MECNLILPSCEKSTFCFLKHLLCNRETSFGTAVLWNHLPFLQIFYSMLRGTYGTLPFYWEFCDVCIGMRTFMENVSMFVTKHIAHLLQNINFGRLNMIYICAVV